MSKLLCREYTNFELHVEQILKPLGDEEAPASTWKLQLGVKHGAQLQRVQIGFEEIDSVNLEKHTSCTYASQEERKKVNKDLREMVQEAMQTDEKVLYYPAESGWYLEPVKAFAAGGELLVGDVAETNLHFKTTTNSTRIAADLSMPVDDAVLKFLERIQEHARYRIPAFAYTLMAAIRSLWHEADIPFAAVLYIVGESGTGKSTLAKNYCQLYNEADGVIADVYDGKSTVAALEAVLDNVRDRTVLFDDLCKTSDKGDYRKRKENATTLLRFVANEMKRTKRRGNQLSDAVCKAGLVITAEYPLDEESELTRCIMVQIQEPRVGGTDEDRVLAATVLRGYINWMISHVDDELASMRKKKKDFLTPKYPGEERLTCSYKQLNWCMGSFLRFVESIMEGGATEALGDEFNKVLYGTFEEQRRFMQQQKVRMEPLKKHIAAGITSQQLKGFQHNGFFCTQLDDLVNYLQMCTQRPEITANYVSGYLRRERLVSMDNSKEAKLTKKIQGRRYVFISLVSLGLVIPPSSYRYN